MQRNGIGERVLGLPREPSFDTTKPFNEVLKQLAVLERQGRLTTALVPGGRTPARCAVSRTPRDRSRSDLGDDVEDRWSAPSQGCIRPTGPAPHEENTMAKYLLLKHYRGAPAPANDVPMDQWTPDEVDAHIEYMQRLRRHVWRSTGEFVDGQALSPDGVWVRSDGEGRAAGDRRPVRRDEGPHRRLDDDRRRQLRAGDRARRRAVGGARRRRRADPRVARGPAVHDRAADRHE